MTHANAIDITPLLQALVYLAGITLSAFGSLALRAAARRWHVQMTAEQADTFDAALCKALSFGVVQADALIRNKGWDHPVVKQAVLSTALQYVTERLPGALAGVGLSSDVNDPQNRQVILDALARALPNAFTVAARSPATPPADAGPTPPTTAKAL